MARTIARADCDTHNTRVGSRHVDDDAHAQVDPSEASVADWTLRTCFLSATLLGGSLVAQNVDRAQSCVRVLDSRDSRPVAGVRVSIAGAEKEPAAASDASGRACLADKDSVGLQIDAVGYLPIDLVLGTQRTTPVTLQRMPAGVMLQGWASRQLAAALAQALGRPEVARDSIGYNVLSLTLARMDSVPLLPTVTRDSNSVLLASFLDLATDGSRFSEIRMRYSRGASIVLGVTTTVCGEPCTREHDVAVGWTMRDDAGWAPQFMARTDSGGSVLRTSFDTGAATPPPSVAIATTSAEPSTDSGTASFTIRGVIRSEKGAPLAGIDVFSADGAATTTTNDRGEYRLAVPLPPGGALITTQRLGWVPAFHKVSREDTASASWSPRLKSTAVLATRFVRAAGIPDALQSFRYDGFLARRARGVGQFFMAEEIWSATSLGDVLNRARGISAHFTYGSNLKEIRVPSCPKAAAAVGVFVDGVDQTGIVGNDGGELNAALYVLPRYVNSAVVGMEIYIGRTQLPGEFADPRYCAVIALWTR